MRCHGFADSILKTGEVRDYHVKDRRIVGDVTAVVGITTVILIPRAIMVKYLGCRRISTRIGISVLAVCVQFAQV
ncbi:MAG: hypothetical protein D6823_00665 [Chloroflexi bacterium]|nr:MAG: hypothetical protein D6823_00665 [Chloroflexota bacterium]